ncbi:MAG: response regulator [Acidimicrobiales bacterium]
MVDDDHVTRTSFRSLLRTAGYNAEEAENGFVALECLRSSSVGSLLLEVNMAGLDGLRLLDRLENPPPVILMGGGEYGNDIILRRAKVFMYIQKPIPSAHLLAAVSRTLTATRQMQGSLIGMAPGAFGLRTSESESM